MATTVKTQAKGTKHKIRSLAAIVPKGIAVQATKLAETNLREINLREINRTTTSHVAISLTGINLAETSLVETSHKIAEISLVANGNLRMMRS